MRTIFKKQSTQFSCGVASLRNCLAALDYFTTERTLREYAHTTHNGTALRGLCTAIKRVGFKPVVIRYIDYSPFIRKIVTSLKNGGKIILLTDHEEHWCSIINYHAKQFFVIDPERGQPLNKYLTSKELEAWCRNFSKSELRTYFLAIGVFSKQ